MHETLIGAPELIALLADRARPTLVFDCRHRLGDGEAGRRLYREGHVPGAIFAALDRDLADPPASAPGGHPGRHPLPEPGAWLSRLGAFGLTPATQAVAYDDAGGAYAARLWWMLRAVGHRPAAVLDGGLAAWSAAGGALERGDVLPVPSPVYPGRFDVSRLAGYDEVREAASGKRPDLLLLDARDPARFRGDQDPVDPIPGHIPGARNAPFAGNLTPEGRFRSREEIAARFAGLLEGRPPQQVVSYCGSGVTACHNLLALEVAGLDGCRLFVPSWSGWCRTTGLPLARGVESAGGAGPKPGR